MATVAQGIEIYQGEDKSFDFYVKDDNGDPQTLTTAAASWQAWRAGAQLISKSTSDGISIINGTGTDDVVRLTLAKEDTANVEPGVYYHECRVSLNGNETLIATGTIAIVESKTA